MTFKSNARMYSVSSDAEAAWQRLIAHVAEDAGTSFAYVTYEAPRPLEELWRRADLGCVQMCGFPIARNVAGVVPLTSPVPAAAWAGGNALYRSELIVRRDAAHENLADTFGGTVGWTVEHAHSGFNALRHHRLPRRSHCQARLYRRSVGNLGTARRILESVVDGTIEIGPLDGYRHMLMREYHPAMTENIRIPESTATAPMPAFVAARASPDETVNRLRESFSTAHSRPWFGQFREALRIEGFAKVTRETFDSTLEWDRAARAAAPPPAGTVPATDCARGERV